MALYYAPAIGCYLLGKCFYLGKEAGWEIYSFDCFFNSDTWRSSKLFLRLAITTLASFYVIFFPLMPPVSPLSVLNTSISRIFPFSRGIFEDKVANFWCATDVIIKWRVYANPDTLMRLSTALTALGFTPSVIGLLWHSYKNTSPVMKESVSESLPTPTLPLLPYALLTSSMSFFMFSFMVHEKTILLPLLPLVLIGSGAPTDSFSFQWITLVSNVASFRLESLAEIVELISLLL